MMKLSISRCKYCKRIRLIDKSSGENVCFACKHLVKQQKEKENEKEKGKRKERDKSKK